MSGKIDGVPRELLEVIANSSERTMVEINAAIQQAREILAAPVVERQEPCENCDGTGGIKVSGGSDSCPVCRGRGVSASSPAPVAVHPAIHEQLVEMRRQFERGNFVALGEMLTACLDKAKELNQ